ncbi:hypothetical protein GCM10023185_01240 [Hymenobacter saemangeumensis]|uniref:Tetratricopeptide repeat protein n=1 Tax=Hymenobacter saemangeumensis TaxID=1084522 RepID=A0ABP8HX93_9BACT
MGQTTQALGRWPRLLALLAALALGLAGYYYVTGEDAAVPLRLVPALSELPLTLDTVPVAGGALPVQVSGFIVSLTHDLAGPFTQPVAATLFMLLLGFALAGWIAVVSTLPRSTFIAGMAPVIFLLMSLNTEALGVFQASERYFLYLMLGTLGGVAFGLHAFAEGLSLRWRWVILLFLVAGLSLLLFTQSAYTAAETVLQLAAYATPGGAVVVALLVLWVGLENIRALLWFNAQAEQPSSRFGLGPFLAASLLYLGVLFWLVWNGGQLELFPGLSLDPLVFLLPAVLTGWLGLRLRAASYTTWVPYREGADQLYPLLVMAAAGALGYAFASANTPLLAAARDFTAQTLLMVGGAFWLYVLLNFMPLIRQRLRVYRVVFEPRRMPFYTVYILAIGAIIMVQVRNGRPLPDQVSAGQFNYLGDLTRQQSETSPDDVGLALLAERYYAESGDVLYRANRHAQLGRAALYRFRQERQNEINALRRALLREPSEKVSLRLAAILNDKADLFEALDVLRQGLKAQPRSAALAGALAQRFTQTSLTDSVAFYLDKAEQLDRGSYASQTNQLAFLLQQNLVAEAQKLAMGFKASAKAPALASNLALLSLLQGKASSQAPAPADVPADTDLDGASFAQLYHGALAATRQRSTAWLPVLARLNERPANEPYYEQLIFLQALTRHAAGQEQAARQTLAPLTAGTSPTAGYYQYLLGLWQLQQGQYAAAASQLGLATQHGAPAALAQAYAAGLAGRLDSARAQAARLLASPDSAMRVAARQLQDRLADGSLGAATSTATPRVGGPLLAQARAAAQARQTEKAARLFSQVVQEAPFNQEAVLAAAAFYEQQRNHTAAYEALRKGLDENPDAPALLRAYVLAAADAGLTEYANDALSALRQQLSPADYAALMSEYGRHRAAREAAAASFSSAPIESPLP